MSGTWSRWVRRRRIFGLALLTMAAVASAVAALLWFTGDAPFASFFIGLSVSLILSALFWIISASGMERHGRTD